MLNSSDSRTSRVVEMRRPSEPAAKHFSISQAGQRSLPDLLAGLRSEMDGLAIRLAREHGVASQATVRAEQISHAIQRLEWVLERNGEDPSAS